MGVNKIDNIPFINGAHIPRKLIFMLKGTQHAVNYMPTSPFAGEGLQAWSSSGSDRDGHASF